MDDLLEDVGIQFVTGSEELDQDEQAAKRERYQGVDKGAIETDAAYGSGTGTTDQDDLPVLIVRLATHQLVKLDGGILDGDFIVNDLQQTRE